jgi:hypothetical protein
MISKHVDILAIAILLFGMALFSARRNNAPVVVLHKRTVIEPFRSPVVVLPKPPYVTLTVN